MADELGSVGSVHDLLAGPLALDVGGIEKNASCPEQLCTHRVVPGARLNDSQLIPSRVARLSSDGS